MIEVFCEFEFSAAHSLPFLPASHKCHRVHGHNYRVVVSVSAPRLDAEKSWVLDYAEIDRAFRDRVHGLLDHRNLNEVLKTDKTTSEFVASWIAEVLDDDLPGHVKVTSVEVWETAHFGARWTAS